MINSKEKGQHSDSSESYVHNRVGLGRLNDTVWYW